MSYISPQGEASTSSEISMVTGLFDLPISGLGEFIRKTGTDSFENATPAEIGLGSVTMVTISASDGIVGSVTNPGSTPEIVLSLGGITPTTVNGLTFTSALVGFTIAGGTTSKTLTVPLDASVSGTNTGDNAANSSCLALDQTTPQTIINGFPLYEDAHADFTDQHQLVDKEYVDSSVLKVGSRFYMLDAADGDVAAYKQCSITASALATANVSASVDAEADTLIEEWISPAALTFELLKAGVYDLNIFAEKTAGNRAVRVFWRFYERKADTSEVLIATSNLSELVTSKARLRVYSTLSTDYTPAAGSRLVGKVYFNTVSGSQNTTCVLYYQGDEDSHWQIPINQEFLDANYLKLSGGTMTGDILGAVSLGSTGTRLTKGWFVDLEATNAIAGSVTGNAGTVTNATLTTALTVNTGTVTLTGNVANSSVLTIGAGAVSVSGANTGDGTYGIANTNYVKIDAADVADNDYAKFTANGLEGKSYSEVLSDIGGAAAVHTHEGTAILSTNEAGGTKYLREDGDGTCSWQSVAGSGDMLLGTAQTVTALKTFDKDKIAMKGTSTGVNTISVANTSATSYTNTMPAKDGTFAMTTDIVSQVEDNITDGHTTIAPSGNAVFDALALKAPLTTPTFATSITGSYLTASEILITDGSKKIVSAAVATYPSLTELSYVKGLSSAVQTQLGNKASTATTMTIAGTANQITSSAGAQDLSANRTWTLSLPADVLIPTVLTVPNTGLHLLDTNASHDLIIKPGSNLTADKTFTLTTGDADMNLNLTAVTDEYVLAYDSGTNTWRGAAASGGGITWSAVTDDGNLVADTGTLANKGTLLTLTLPATIAVGKTIRVAGMNAGLWKIAQGANQYVKFGNQATTTGAGGYLASVATYDAIELVCIEANLGFTAVSSVGNITIA